eukprot:1854121-Rhodomonas_salina.1
MENGAAFGRYLLSSSAGTASLASSLASPLPMRLRIADTCAGTKSGVCAYLARMRLRVADSCAERRMRLRVADSGAGTESGAWLYQSFPLPTKEAEPTAYRPLYNTAK